MKQYEVLAMLHNIVADNQEWTTWTVSTPHLVMLVNKAIEAEREACAKIVETYRIPVGNSAAGEMACEWTHDALKEILDDIRARGQA